MRSITTRFGGCLLALATVVPLSPSPGAALEEEERSASLTEAERAELLDMLDASDERLRELVAELDEAQWTWRSAPERWSVGECVEHILLSEGALLAAAQTALGKPAVTDWAERTQGKEQLLRQVMPNRNPGGAGGASAPQEIRPTGTLSKAETLQKFAAQRAEVRDFVEHLSAPLRAHIEAHPFPIFGDLSAYEWVLYIPLHTVRHTRQLIEVQESEGYPAP
jgi:hypothetical protein